MASDSATPETGGDAAGGTGAAGPAAGKVTAAEIARDWGCSRAYVSVCINKKGCPTESLTAAREWRQVNAKYGVGYRSKSKAPPSADTSPVCEADKKSTLPQVVSFDAELASLEESRQAAVKVEEQALRLVEEAMSAGKPSVLESRLRAYNVACKNRSEREAAVREEMERREILVSMSAAKALFARAWQTVVPKLLAMGSRIGIQCNQADPLLAANTIDAEVISILGEGEKAYAAA